MDRSEQATLTPDYKNLCTTCKNNPCPHMEKMKKKFGSYSILTKCNGYKKVYGKY